MKASTVITFIICLAIPLVVGSISGIAAMAGVKTWYAELVKPSFNPPNYLFGPVWTALYLLMGISLFLIWQSPAGIMRIQALWIFAIQLILNFAWSFIFFYFRQAGWAFFEIILIWICIVAMLVIFYRVSKPAAFLQIPYLLWVTFASALNGSVWLLN
ncbi:MAG: tryptophan-rich sensory protein [Bacteroidales bacterium]|jgi:tryptophan-rich sensory protein|nr:tryptophan-rich sensory protein [Bacteroidales bacterium]